MPTLTEVRSLAMKLPKTSRLRLANELFESSSAQSGGWAAKDILSEASRREHEIESGEAKAISLDQFIALTQPRRHKLAQA